MNSPSFVDCNSPGYDCYTGYGREDELEPVQNYSTIPPELTEEYLEAQRRAEEAVQMMEDSLAIFESLYWAILWDNATTSFISWTLWLKVKLIAFGVELLACFLAGSVLLAVLGILLGCVGPLRIKNLALLVVTFIISSTFAWGSIEFAATSIIGLLLWMFIFVSRMTACEVVKEEAGGGSKSMVVVNCKFWYAGSRTLSVNVSEGLIGVLSDDYD
ncbi:hypothetical protein Ocin01_07700 [Orchesella cincta]|uniref:Uncharacterized protein n=1 Tax=Orchesella cincta TaxID=48709 RepID=A0A1D2N101_ORCCI|nr:hypothetical protein Ocin01_07700 [Orchesella cincta]